MPSLPEGWPERGFEVLPAGYRMCRMNHEDSIRHHVDELVKLTSASTVSAVLRGVIAQLESSSVAECRRSEEPPCHPGG